MLGYRKKSFVRAHTMLTALRANADDLGTLKALQQLLVREIISAEKKIRKLKADLRAIQEIGGRSSAKRSSYLKNRVERLRQVAYVWRCFGDAIAFLYMDKFALKQSFYSTKNANPKQNAGFIADKSGFVNEIALLEAALEHNVPALLVDLTTTIRHGDICLMGAPDPYLIEVKTSKRLNRRGKKQRRALRQLHVFFETDKAAELRGFRDVRRIPFEMPERTYVEDLKTCITDALRNGYAIRKPERGLFYVVMVSNGANPEHVMHSLELKAPWVFALNEFKLQRAWAPYLPFTLSISEQDHLWDFIRGDLYIVVLVELDSLCQIALDNGYEAKFDRDNEDYPLQVRLPGIEEMAGVSSQLLARIGMEFVSPEWAVLASIEILKKGHKAFAAE